MFTSIRSKLVIITSVSIALCASLVFVLSLNEHRNLYRQSVHENLAALSANMADNLFLSMVSGDDEFTITAELLEFERYDNIKYVIVYDESWKQLQQYVRPRDLNDENLNANSLFFDASTLPIAITAIDDYLVSLQTIGEPSVPLGYLLVVQDLLEPLEQSRVKLFNSAGPLALITILLTILGSWWLYQRLLAPLLKLSQFTQEVKQTQNYQLKVDVKGNDEVAQLSDDINNMLETIDHENKINLEQNKTLLEQQESMRRMADFDMLTNLPNRAYFTKILNEELEKAKLEQRDLAVMFFDVDGFKGINDSLGHEAGDQLLVEVSRIVRGCLREGDVLARLGGDEFLIMIPVLPDPEIAANVAKRILNALKNPLQLASWEVQSGVSIGIARAKQSEYTLSGIISNADLAMYVSKGKGKGIYTEFCTSMLEQNQRRTKIGSLLPKALATSEFKLFYQLKVSSDGRVNGAEALLRWVNDELGFVSPAEFIPIAEKGGKIHAITEWVINRAMLEFEQLRQKCGNDFVLSLNVSSQDLENPKLIDIIRGAVTEHKVDIRNFQFEITESSYLNNFDGANAIFNEISRLGGSIALDDFGTGYSSLSYLTRIKIDTLKIDRMFVCQYQQSSQDAAILQTILDLARRIGLKTCCEGIEELEQARYLLQHGCNQMQGYLFAKPVALTDINSDFLDKIIATYKRLKIAKKSSTTVHRLR